MLSHFSAPSAFAVRGRHGLHRYRRSRQSSARPDGMRAARSRSIQIRPRVCGIGQIRTALELVSAKCGDSPRGAHWVHCPDELCSPANRVCGKLGMSDTATPQPVLPHHDGLPPPAMATSPRHARDTCGRALAYLRQHFSEKVTLADLAAAAGVSERTLRRNFPRFVGCAPLAYLRQLRLTAVRNELSRGEDAISRVAARHGFTHFGRFAMPTGNALAKPRRPRAEKARRDFAGCSSRAATSEQRRNPAFSLALPARMVAAGK